MLNLLVSESLSIDSGLDRVAAWMHDVDGFHGMSALDEEPAEHPGRIASGQEPSWLNLRRSTLRGLFSDGN